MPKAALPGDTDGAGKLGSNIRNVPCAVAKLITDVTQVPNKKRSPRKARKARKKQQ